MTNDHSEYATRYVDPLHDKADLIEDGSIQHPYRSLKRAVEGKSIWRTLLDFLKTGTWERDRFVKAGSRIVLPQEHS